VYSTGSPGYVSDGNYQIPGRQISKNSEHPWSSREVEQRVFLATARKGKRKLKSKKEQGQAMRGEVRMRRDRTHLIKGRTRNGDANGKGAARKKTSRGASKPSSGIWAVDPIECSKYSQGGKASAESGGA